MASAGRHSGNGKQIAILGAGSLGRLWAALLPSGRCGFLPRSSGTRCEYVLVRSASPDSVKDPVPVSRHWLTNVDNVDLLLVTTKAGDTLSALSHWLPRIPEDTPVVLFQNGLGSQQRVVEHWPERPILAASTTEGANRPSPDVLIHAGVGDTWVGALTAAAENRTARVVQQLAVTGLRTHIESNILSRLWQKLVINAGINPFTALLNCPNGDILGSPLYQQTINGLCAEIALLLHAETSECVTPEMLQEQIEVVANSTAGNTSSMRADVNAGRNTEIDFINGYLVQCGQQHGIATPVNQMLVNRVKALNTA